MKIKILISLLITYVSVCSAQQLKPLTVGDKVPDVVFKTMLNHKTPSGKLSDFKGKALIIDMWFRECGSCVDAMPHLDSLQKAYKNDLQVLLVTWQSKEKIEDFWKQRLPVQGIKFTQVVEDTLIKALFPAVGYPHQIWIDKNGIVKSINDGRQTTKENVDKLIAGKELAVTIKKDELDPLVHNAVLPMAGIRYKENKSKILHYSYLSEHRSEFGGKGFIEPPENGVVRFRCLNYDYISLYHCAYSGSFGVPLDYKNRVIRKDHNPLKHEPDFKTFSNVFCYDLIFRDTANSSFGKYMVEDLDKYLGFKSHEEIRQIKTLVIRPNGKGTTYKNALLPEERRIQELNNFKNGKHIVFNKNFVNKAILEMLNRVIISYSAIPAVFEFPENISVNFRVTWNTDNVATMNKELEKFDIEAVIEDRPIKVIILEDPK